MPYPNMYVPVRCVNPKCRKEFKVRKNDRNRGWGLYCSRSCREHCERLMQPQAQVITS